MISAGTMLHLATKRSSNSSRNSHSNSSSIISANETNLSMLGDTDADDFYPIQIDPCIMNDRCSDYKAM
jgi:hypothetical protein